jgi:hypothetical protein
MSLDRGRLAPSLWLPAALAALVLALSLLGAPSVRADLITYGITAGNTALSPYAGPYASVTVDRTSTTTATITFTSNSVAGNTYLLGDGGIADVNVNATSWTIGGFSSTNAGIGFSPASLSNTGSGNVDSFGVFNQTLKNFDGFTYAADSVTFTLTNASPTWATAADVLTPNADGNVAAAHIFVCTDIGGGTCDQAAGALTTGFAAQVPEPSTALLLGLGGSILAARRPRRRRLWTGGNPLA